MTNDNPGYIVTPESTEIAGLVSYWRLAGDINLERLRKGLAARTTIDDKALPKAPAPETALRRAVMQQQRKRRLVRPLKERGKWVVKDEFVLEDGSDTQYRTVCQVALGEDGVPTIATAGDVDFKTFTTTKFAILNAFGSTSASLAPEDISAWLVRQTKAFKALSLRDRGGVYFLPRPCTDTWRTITEILNDVSEGNHQVFNIPAMRNEEAVAALIDAMTQEAQEAVLKVQDELNAEEGIGERALANRADECQELLDKVSAYEKLLGVRMDTIHEKIGNLRAAVTAAKMAA